MKLVFATNNQYKLNEVRRLLNGQFNIAGLKDINCFEELPENSNTLEKNASQKSFYLHSKYQVNCFADDTGLEIDALNGEPGVYSARYAGDKISFDDNMNLVLENMQGIENRKAVFRTVISLFINGIENQFEGITTGTISENKQGSDGFGYDPIFIPDGFNISYAQMSLEEKNKISHRGKAIRKLIEYLNNCLSLLVK